MTFWAFNNCNLPLVGGPKPTISTTAWRPGTMFLGLLTKFLGAYCYTTRVLATTLMPEIEYESILSYLIMHMITMIFSFHPINQVLYFSIVFIIKVQLGARRNLGADPLPSA